MERCIVKGSELQYLNHPWVYKGNIVDCKAEKGACVEVYSRKGSFLGSAIYNPDSSIVLRFYSRQKEELNYFAIKERLIRADENRKKYFRLPFYRLAYSESDHLPGLVVDRYGDGVVFQINSYGMDKRRDEIIKAIYDAFSPKFIIEKSSGFARKQENLPEREEVILNESTIDLSRVIVEENGFKFYVDLISGQKTGYFFDQRRNRELLRSLSGKGIVLDAFSYIGTFAIMLAEKADKVYAVDISEESLELLRENVKLNNIPEKKFVIELKDAFDFLKELADLKIKFDIIVLDPPSMVRRARDIDNAMKAYFELLADSINVLNKNGLIALFSCSNHIKWNHMFEIVAKGTCLKNRSFRILDYLHQDFRDHVVPSGFPEAEYLRGFVIKEE